MVFHRMMMEGDIRLYHSMFNDYADEKTGTRGERYPNKVAGSSVLLVVFPGLPEKTLFAASLLTMAEERSYTDGTGGNHVTRTYKRLKEEKRAV